MTPDPAQLYRAIVEAAHEGIWVVDDRGVTQFVNDRMASILGYERDEMIGRHVVEFVGDADRDEMVAAITRRAAGVPEQYEARYRRRDGDDIWVAISAAPLLGDGGRVVGSVAMVSDITEAHRMGDEMRRSEARFRALVEHSSDMVSVIDAEGTLRFHYPPAVLGYAEGENFGRDVLAFIHPDDAAEAVQRLAAAIAEPGHTAPFEFRLRAADGSWRWVEAVATNLLHDPAVQGIVINSRDVTERKRADDFERQARDLARSNRELEEFAYMASHELSQPLRLVDAHARALAEEHVGQLDDLGRQRLDVIVRRVERMETLVAALLSYARTSSAPMRADAVDCRALVTEVVDEIRPLLASAAGTVTIGELPVVRGDATQLGQVFRNLVSNAVKFARPDRRLRVRIGAARQADGWAIEVVDNGVGVPAAARNRVLRMFERLHSEDRYPGTGIGLALCARIVERHGGRLWIDDGDDGGTAVRFVVPALVEQSDQRHYADMTSTS